MEIEQKSFEGMVEVQQNTVCLAHYSKYEHKLYMLLSILTTFNFLARLFHVGLILLQTIQSK